MSSGNPQRATDNAGAASPSSQAEVPQHLQRLDRLANLGLFSASIAHEIKNGLVAINTFCQLLAESAEHRELAGVACRELKRIDELVTQMLRLASPKPATLSAVDAHTLLDGTLALLEYQWMERGITLRREYRAERATLQADESRLQQALMNLLLNAIEAMDLGGELTVATEVRGANLCLSIRDTGGGIAPEHLERIFETFFTTKKQGTGLGLAISRRVVEEHQGNIQIQSQVGRGTTFWIHLPLS